MTTSSPQAARRQIESKLLDMAFGKVALSSASALLLSTLIVAALWPIVEHARLLSWFAAMAFVQVHIYFYARRYLRSARMGEPEQRKWRAGLVAGGLAAGLCWGSTVFYFPPAPFNPETVLGIFILPSSPFDPVTVLLMFILAGVTAYASVAMAFVLSFAITFLVCTLLPLSIWLFSYGEHMYVVMGLITLCYLGVMIMLSRRMYASVRNLLEVSEENKGLRTTQQQSDWRMQRFFESAPGFFYTACMAPDGTATMPFASDGIRELFGIPASAVEHTMQPLFERVHPDDLARLLEARAASRQNLSPLHIEFRISHPQKGERWIELHSLPQREQDGETSWHGFMQDITGRKRLEEATRQQSELHQTLLDAINDVGLQLMVIENGRITFASNRKLTREFGYSEADLAARPELMDIIHPDDRARVQDMHLRRLAGEPVPSSYELALVTRSGERREYETSVSIVPGTYPVRLISIGKDITERKRMEAELRRREAEFRALAENAPDPIYRYDRNCRRIYINPAVERLTGKPLDQLLGKSPVEAIPTPDVNAVEVQATIQRVLDTGQPGELEVDFIAANGRRTIIHNALVPEFAVDGTVQTVLCIGRDITAHKRIEEVLQRSEVEYRTLAANLPVAVIRYDAGQRRHYLNPAAERMLHGSMESLLGKMPGDGGVPASPEMIGRYRDRMAEVLASGEACEFEFVLDELPPEQRESFEVRFAPERDAAWKVSGVLAIWFDITERRQTQQRLELLEHAMAVSADAIYLIDDDLRFSYVNDAACRTLGYTREELLAMGPHDIDPGASREIAQQVLDTSPLGVAISFETQHRAKDGRNLPVELHGIHFERNGRKFGLSLVRDITERKAIEQALRNSENMLQEAQRIAHVGSWDVDMVNDRLTWSDETFRIWEIDKTKFRADFAAFLETVHPEDRERVARVYNESVVNHTLYEVEHRLLFPDGRIKHILERGEPQYDAQGKPVRFIGTCMDITERKRMEARIVERERDFRSLAQNMPDNIARWDVNGHYLFVNPTHERLLGRKLAELIGQPIPDSHAQVKAGVMHVVASGQTIHAVRQPVLVDGVEELHDVSLVPEYDETGRLVSVLGIGRDMTERYRMLETIATREQEFRSLAESSPDFIIRYDRAGRTRYLNGALIRLLGLESADEVIGKRPSESWPDGRFDAIEQAAAQAVETGVDQHLEIFGPRANGELGYSQLFVVPERDANGLIVGTIAFGRDITEIKQVTAQLDRERAILRTFFDAMPSQAWIKDCEGRYLACNPMHERYFGAPEAEVIGKTDFDFVEAELAAFFRQKDKEAEAAGKPCVNEEWVTFADDGRQALLETVKAPVFDAEGRIVGVIGVAQDITERRRAELALRLSEEQAQSRSNLLNAIVESSPDVIVFALDTQYRYLSFNRKHKETMQAIWGKEIAIGMSMLDVIGDHPDREKAKQGFDRALSGESFALEEAYGDELLSRQYWQNYWSPIRAETGGVIGLTCFVMNVTERRRAEEALRESGEKLRNLYDYSPVGIALTDMEGRYIEFNEAFRAICGYPHEELMTLDYWTLTPREYEAQEMAQMDALEKTGRYGPYVKEYVRKDGSRVPIQLNGALIIGKDMKPYIWSIVEDITERKRTEAILKERFEHIVELNLHLEANARTLEEQTVELEASQEQLKESLEFTEGIINAIPDILFEVDREGRYHNIWTQDPELLAAQKHLLLGNTIDQMLPPDAAEISMAAIREAEEKGLSFGKILRLILPQGESWFELSVSRKPGGNLTDPRFVVLSRDVTERQAMEVAREAALAEAQRLVQMRSAFMAQMSHELRTPLNGILGYAQNLLQGGGLGEKQTAGLNIIRHSGEHLLSLINGLLDHAAIEAGKFELVPDDFELQPFLSGIIGIIRVRAEQKNLAFSCEAAGDLPAVVHGDAQRLRQVLINLLANAVKFTDSGAVTLRVQLGAPSRIRFEVQDSGVGIAADQLENIFLPFEQTGELQRRAGGSGLGLAISRTLVRLMGGDIRVESRPGAGSTFSFEVEIGNVQNVRSGFDAAGLSAQAETHVAQATSLLAAPPRAELDILHGYARRGSMRDVVRHADWLAEAEARYRPFAAQLRQLAQTFQTRALLALIEQYRDREQQG